MGVTNSVTRIQGVRKDGTVTLLARRCQGRLKVGLDRFRGRCCGSLRSVARGFAARDWRLTGWRQRKNVTVFNVDIDES